MNIGHNLKSKVCSPEKFMDPEKLRNKHLHKHTHRAQSVIVACTRTRHT